MNTLLIDENPMMVIPSLVKAVGLEQAIVLQQLHFVWRQPKSGKVLASVDLGNGRTIDGSKWIYNTAKGWREDYFSFWQPDNVRKLFVSLETRGLVISCQPDSNVGNMRKYYRIDYERFSEIIANLLSTGRNTPHPVLNAECPPSGAKRRMVRCQTPNGLVGKIAVSIDKTETSSYIERSANAPPAETPPVTHPINPEPTPPQSDEIKSDHPAIALVRSLMRSYPNKINWPEIVTALGSTPDKHRASQCYAEWVGRGSNPRSIKPFTEWYCTGIPTQRKPGSYQPAEQASRIGKGMDF